MAETLWQIIEKWPHEFHGENSSVKRPDMCPHCQIEAWARKKAKEYRRLSANFLGDTACGRVIEDLGVPEGK